MRTVDNGIAEPALQAATLPARYTTEDNGDSSVLVSGDPEKHGHGKVEVRTRRIASAAIIAGKSVSRRAEVGDGDGDEDGGGCRSGTIGANAEDSSMNRGEKREE